MGWMVAITITACALVAWCALQQHELNEIKDELKDRSDASTKRDTFDCPFNDFCGIYAPRTRKL